MCSIFMTLLVSIQRGESICVAYTLKQTPSALHFFSFAAALQYCLTACFRMQIVQ